MFLLETIFLKKEDFLRRFIHKIEIQNENIKVWYYAPNPEGIGTYQYFAPSKIVSNSIVSQLRWLDDVRTAVIKELEEEMYSSYNKKFAAFATFTT